MVVKNMKIFYIVSKKKCYVMVLGGWIDYGYYNNIVKWVLYEILVFEDVVKIVL